MACASMGVGMCMGSVLLSKMHCCLVLPCIEQMSSKRERTSLGDPKAVQSPQTVIGGDWIFTNTQAVIGCGAKRRMEINNMYIAPAITSHAQPGSDDSMVFFFFFFELLI